MNEIEIANYLKRIMKSMSDMTQTIGSMSAGLLLNATDGSSDFKVTLSPLARDKQKLITGSGEE